MVVDKSVDERFELGRQISEKERQISSLMVEKNKSRQVLENLERDVIKNFRKLESLNNDLIKEGSRPAQWLQSEDAAVQKGLSHLLAAENEKLRKIFNKAIHNLEDERTQLQKERSDLPWD